MGLAGPGTRGGGDVCDSCSFALNAYRRRNPDSVANWDTEGAIAPLMAMASYGSDMQKLGALGALDVMTVNNAGGRCAWPSC